MDLFYELSLGSWDQSGRGELFRSETLTVLPVQQNLKTVGLVVVECLSHLLGGLLVSQLSVHETVKGNRAAVGPEPLGGLSEPLLRLHVLLRRSRILFTFILKRTNT